ncbi:hypothetical protein GUITHDRAFT_152593 [Guillardia theta CCMP2712]|uniref:Uncharacterized protein n=1 Tax=Guillardia theta (strain CCMP2712) TaxID=905079 RepID=L1JC60_GUITC|nr:hypothetical protein GUITHDRAFT_152593 [Guillardia theta CCMP2712]EKX45882.1 hypothetical protein GUITHDRAFT_152593 [Guillardia theta CCMP2712]|mmetsp:Transcript_39060/g.123172  ORF Transcript_39060/g.123172 Transcript_39060/m.123172 type:complete len:292 (-) Transcript_39060:695-1570(-)|eukprot:XP_005832862.1 hypothetical protein GUITHDRAFT_152593 [Guillardia theta CCMP2712]
MPTACEWMQGQRAHRKGKNRFWKQQKVWGGGTWKTKVGYQPPSQGCPGSFLTRDGRAWTPGPGRYSEGNPMESSVRYDRLKFSKTHSLLDEQKRRWPGDSCPMAWQPAGVIVNPARGFSMGSGCGPGECWMREVERRSRITSFGFNYRDIAPDLVIGEHAKTSRAGPQGSVFHAAGGGLAGVVMQPDWYEVQVKETPGPGHYGSDYTYSNIGTRDNALARLSSKETPPAFGFGSSERGEDYSKRSHEVPGPASYRPQALTWIGGHGQNKSLRVRGGAFGKENRWPMRNQSR